MKLLTKILIIILLSNTLPATVVGFSESSAVSYLKANSSDDWVIMALASSGKLDGVSLGLLNSDPGNKATDIEKRMLARYSAGLSDNGLSDKLESQFNGTEISAGQGLLNDDIFGLLALSAFNTKSNIRTKLAEFIKQNQNPDGGWGFAHSPTSSDSNDTAMAIMALIANGEGSSNTINRAFDYLNSTKKGGGFAFSPEFNKDTASTAWVVSAYLSAGRSVPASAISYLNDQQKANGSFVWQTGPSGTPLMTAYATIALNNDFYPVKKAGSSGGGGGTTPKSGNVGGGVLDQNGNAVAGAVIDTCHHGNQVTDNNGKWLINLPEHSNLCARIISLPSGYDGATSSNNTPETVSANTYEFQISGTFCRNSSVCIFEQEKKWDIADDLELNFRVNKINKPSPPPPPPPSDPSFEVAIISPIKTEFVGTLSFSDTKAINTVINSGITHKITNTSFGPFVESIAGFTGSGTEGWMYAVNGTKPGIGAADYVLNDGDQVIWFFDHFSANPPPFPGEGTGPQSKATVNLKAEIIKDISPPVTPTVTLSLSKSKIKIGESVTLNWSTQNANKVVSSSPDNWAGQNLSGSIKVQPIQTTTYNLIVSGSPEASASATVEVDRTPSITFGVSSSSADFGPLKPGQSSESKNLILQNFSSSKLEITASLQQNTELFRRGLKINSKNFDQFKETVSGNQTTPASLSLEVPDNFTKLGTQTDTLIFWARVK